MTPFLFSFTVYGSRGLDHFQALKVSFDLRVPDLDDRFHFSRFANLRRVFVCPLLCIIAHRFDNIPSELSVYTHYYHCGLFSRGFRLLSLDGKELASTARVTTKAPRRVEREARTSFVLVCPVMEI